MTKSELPMVSIVIPVFNGADYMREAIDSALAQTYANKEVLVINDGSKDDGQTEKIALSYADRIRYFYQPNGGVGSALNLGIANMKGEYFSWLSHDDLYLPRKVEAQVKAALSKKDPTTLIVCAYETFEGLTGKKRSIVNPLKIYSEKELSQSLFSLYRGVVHGCALLIHKSHFERVGLFDVTLPTTQDYDLWFRMFRHQSIHFIPGVYVSSRVHSAQGSRQGNHADEANRLWIKYMDWITDEERVQISGSSYAFYRDIHSSLRNEPIYTLAQSHAVHRAAVLAAENEKANGLLLTMEAGAEKAESEWEALIKGQNHGQVLFCQTAEDAAEAQKALTLKPDTTLVCLKPVKDGLRWVWHGKHEWIVNSTTIFMTFLLQLGTDVIVYVPSEEAADLLHMRREKQAGQGKAILICALSTKEALKIRPAEYEAYDQVLWMKEEPYRILHAESERHCLAANLKQDNSPLAREMPPLSEAYHLLLDHARATEMGMAGNSLNDLKVYYEQTLSWRITKPLRDMKHWLKKRLR